MSSLNSGARLLLKRLEFQLRRSGPDHYIFESQAMARTATHGRGVPARRTSVVYLGVDPEKFRPNSASPGYVHEAFGIPRDRKVLVYSGHMEERKGVRVLLRAAIELRDRRAREDFHWLILGNQDGEADHLAALLDGSHAKHHVTFGGYRRDMPSIFGGCYLGTIASTGWDSFTMSSLEMAAAGLPLLVSNLQGLAETVVPNETGATFPPGDHVALADLVARLLTDPERRDRLSLKARERVLATFTKERQIEGLTSVCRKVFGIHPGGPEHGYGH